LIVAVPYLSVTFPPIADMPQQVAQIRLFLGNLGEPNPIYQTVWIGPNKLAYVILGFFWAVLPPLYVGRASMLIIGMLWILAAYALAARYNRPPASVALVSIFTFNQIFYWGFYSFAVGWPVFILWFILTTRQSPRPSRTIEGALYLLTAFLLYFSHALWFAAGMLWLVLYTIIFRASLKDTLYKMLYLSPAIIMAGTWYARFGSAVKELGSYSTEAEWTFNLVQRASLQWFVDGSFGGLKSWAEVYFFLIVVVWLLISFRQNRRSVRCGTDPRLLLAAAMFFALGFFLPDQYQNTIFMSMRWMPCALILLVLALPAPAFNPKLRLAASLLVLTVFCGITTNAWITFNKNEMSGLKEAIAALPESPRVVGLDLVKFSESVRGWPFLQSFAYAQVARGGTLNFSFAEHASSLIIYKEKRPAAWTAGLEWYGERVKRSDFKYFNYALINALPSQHEKIARGEPLDLTAINLDKQTLISREFIDLAPVTSTGRWRLYKVKESAWIWR